MSRRSQAFAEGVQKFSWNISQQPDGTYKATCINFPHITGTGPSEQFALVKGQEAIDTASRKAELGTDQRDPS